MAINQLNESLVWEHLKLADKVAAECGVDAALVADIALETLRNATQTYDARRGASFAQYARRQLTWMFNKFLNKELTKTNTPLKEICDKDSRVVGTWHCSANVETIHDRSDYEEKTVEKRYMVCCRQKEENPIYTKEGLLALNDEEQHILHLRFVERKTVEQIGIEYGVSKQRISARLKTILEKVRHA